MRTDLLVSEGSLKSLLWRYDEGGYTNALELQTLMRNEKNNV